MGVERMDPGGESGERSYAIVNGRVSQSLLFEARLPCHYITLETGRNAIMPVGLDEKSMETGQVQGDLLRDGFRANPFDGQLEIVGHPGFQTVRNASNILSQGTLHLPYSEFVEIGDLFRSVFRHDLFTLLDRRALLSIDLVSRV